MSAEKMRQAIEANKRKPALPAQAKAPAPQTQGKAKKPPKEKKVREPFVPFRYPEGTTIALQWRGGVWHATLLCPLPSGATLILEHAADGYHRLGRELANLFRAKEKAT